MPTIDDMFPKRFITGLDLDGKAWTLTIERVELTEVYIPPGIRSEKWAVYFQGAKKAMILNKTNAVQIAGVAGSKDTDEWPGTRITIFPQPVKVGRETKIGIRVRKPMNGQAEPPPAMNTDEDDF